MRKLFNATIASIFILSVSQAQIGALIWEENFNDLTNWNQELGNGSWGWGNGELEYYHPDNVMISDIPDEPGNTALHITARAETLPGYTDQWGNQLNFTSGKITTKAKVSVHYGMIETRVRVPDLDLGGWPAVWLLGTANYAWPYNGEMDMMEMGARQEFRDLHDTHNGGNGLNNSTVNQSVGANAIFYSDEALTPENPSGAASISWDPDDEYNRLYYNHDNPLNDRFVIYRLYWDDASLRFTVTDNGIEYDLYTEPFPIDSTSAEFQQPFYLIANLAIGGAFTDAYNLGDPGSGSPVSMPFPADMYVDYIKVYEWNGQGSVNVGPPYPESGTFGIFTDTTPVNGELEAGLTSEIYVWEGTLVDGTIPPYEGENGITWQTTGSGWFGAGILPVQPLNLSNFNEGTLKFMIKIPAGVTFKIGVIDNWGNQNYVTFPANQTTYGLVRDGEWGQASIPVSDLRGVAIDMRMLSYAFVILEESGAACEFGLDDIYYEGGGTANPPIANAGIDQVILDDDNDGEASVTLNGSLSIDRFGSIDEYQWMLNDTILATGEIAEITLQLGEYPITLLVTDNEGNTDSDQVIISVINNYLPTARAGEDQTIIDQDGNGSESIVLDGGSSTDSDGNIISFNWSEAGTDLATGEQVTLDLDIGVHLITLTVTDDDGGQDSDALTIRVNRNLPIAAPAIYQTHAGITVDDQVEDEWGNTPEMGINNVTVGARTADFQAQWKAMYDADNLYLLVEVNDEVLINDSGDGWYMDDVVEVFIDADNSSGGAYDGINDFQFGFRWDDDVIRIGNNSVNNSSGIVYAHYATAVGYNLEVAFPWSLLGVSASSVDYLGFDVAVDDDDNGGDRECAVASIFTADDAWHNPSVFGNVPLVATVGVKGNAGNNQPRQFSLHPNFPNPFNPSTHIRYTLPQSSEISIIVYNTLGQEVSSLFKGIQSTGNHELTFNGQGLSSGVYFVVLRSGPDQLKQKVLLIK
ncbi:MAG: T9SS type A sorting domain-containing protein [Candidatus Marinimicrobia bacterium]|nr:T9SS type A sorting domain-containing protein [Candidatus Neomarinimicrobiota bacterium]MBT3576393.1 T9SS type A sorting domain-containing protein [Candidatus Neomarinimicrobiota bacterium]MBT3680091.1 T9SS type A sorting domain-containing protein [Candidatus Neomarinimicrobiota bacterium]MBT3950076.1 T9SS type A sorting domain-containing protein [Candidatus Neomarinimicrobiota bacterium]MBT4254375.1 T9SS type A sorting domain-containing protein [Candidatus Neomarinimicrobiota bacterium]